VRRSSFRSGGSALRGALLLAAAWLLALAPAGAGAEGKPPEGLPAGLDDVRVRLRAGSRPATPDLVASVWRCPKCGALNSARRLLPEQPPFDKLADVREVLVRVGLGQGGSWPAPKAETCSACRAAAPEKPEITAVFFFRYLPETGCDAVAGAPVRGGRAGAMAWGRLDVSGAYDQVGELADEEHFLAAFGRVLSVRESWAEAAGQSIAKRKPVVVKAAPGYFLTCRKAGTDRQDDERLAAELAVALARQEGAGGPEGRSLALTAADAAGLEKVIPTYRQWLPGQWRQLAEGRYVAAAWVDPAALRRLLGRELARAGVTVEDRRLRLGEYSIALDLDAVLTKTVQAGLTLGEGLHQFVWPDAASLGTVERIGERARAMLAAYQTRVEGGSVLVIREQPAAGAPVGSGAEVARLNLLSLVGEVDPSRPGSVELALTGLLGLDPATAELRPPKAGDRICSCGQPAWLARKPRPKGYFQSLGAKVATVEWRGLDLAWSLDCPDHSRYLLAAGLPPEKELEQRYQQDLDKATFQVLAARGITVEKSQARVAIGPDIAAALADERLRRGLVQRLKGDLPGRDMLFWAPTSNVVLISPQPLEGQVRQEMRRAALEMAKGVGIAPGETLDLEIREKLTANPAGTFSTPPTPPKPPAGGETR